MQIAAPDKPHSCEAERVGFLLIHSQHHAAIQLCEDCQRLKGHFKDTLEELDF